MTARPTLIVISGPAGSGKTTLAHALARAVGCPAICRDEIKEGMVHAGGEFTAGLGDALSTRTLPVFFDVLATLLRAGVTTVAEAAFQDRVWRPRLEPLRALAEIRVVHCRVDEELRWTRVRQRGLRRAHPDAVWLTDRPAFDPVAIDVPQLEVDTTDGYRPSLDTIVSFASGP